MSARDRLLAVLTLGLSNSRFLRLLVRRSLSGLMRLLLRLRSRSYPIQQNTVTLVLAPHPDDETLGCGGLLFCKRSEGIPVHVAYITDGSASHPNHPTLTPPALAVRREAEARQAMAIVGVEEPGLHFLGARDGTLSDPGVAAAEELVARLVTLIGSVRPDEIFLPCRRDGSSEHDASFLLLAKALERSGLRTRILEFPIWSWWNPLLVIAPLFTSRRVWRLDFRGYESLKQQALAVYTSQTTALPPSPGPVLTREFLSFFSSGEEFFFEM